MVLMAALGAVGVIYGIEIGSNLLNKVAFGTMYGFIGVCIAVVSGFCDQRHPGLDLNSE